MLTSIATILLALHELVLIVAPAVAAPLLFVPAWIDVVARGSTRMMVLALLSCVATTGVVVRYRGRAPLARAWAMQGAAVVGIGVWHGCAGEDAATAFVGACPSASGWLARADQLVRADADPAASSTIPAGLAAILGHGWHLRPSSSLAPLSVWNDTRVRAHRLADPTYRERHDVTATNPLRVRWYDVGMLWWGSLCWVSVAVLRAHEDRDSSARAVAFGNVEGALRGQTHPDPDPDPLHAAWVCTARVCAVVGVRWTLETFNLIDSEDHTPVRLVQDGIAYAHVPVLVAIWVRLAWCRSGCVYTRRWRRLVPCTTAAAVGSLYVGRWHRSFAVWRRAVEAAFEVVGVDDSGRPVYGYVGRERPAWYDGVCVTSVCWLMAWLWAVRRIAESTRTPSPASEFVWGWALGAAAVGGGVLATACWPAVPPPAVRLLMAGGVGGVVLGCAVWTPPVRRDGEGRTWNRAAVQMATAVVVLAGAGALSWVGQADNIKTRHVTEYEDTWVWTLLGMGGVVVLG